MACGCGSRNSTPSNARSKSAPRADSFEVPQGVTVGPNEVLVRWVAPVGRNVYVASTQQRGRMYNRNWKSPFAMLKVDAEKFKDAIADVAVAV